ncbi:MAG: HD domain-containing protein [Acidobacteriota bacterium]|nr:HD domain-containing protein [Acidobacteriota bacterium]
MALLHDWAETRVGDMRRTAGNYFGAEPRKAAETAAFGDIVSGAGAAESEYKSLFLDYEQRHSLEAKLVKAADVLDLLIQAYALERTGAKGLDEFWEVAHDADFQLPAIANELVGELLQSILNLRSKLE